MTTSCFTLPIYDLIGVIFVAVFLATLLTLLIHATAQIIRS
jgi:hypothetical protein